MQLEPSSEPYIYAYILSLDGQGESTKALSVLQQHLTDNPSSQQLKQLGLSLAQKSGNKAMYDWFTAL
jgi:hypothetical protein